MYGIASAAFGVLGTADLKAALKSKAITVAASILPTSGQELLHPLHNIRSQKPKPSATPGHMHIVALSAGVRLGMVNPKAALESKVTAAVAPKFHRQPRLRGHPLHYPIPGARTKPIPCPYDYCCVFCRLVVALKLLIGEGKEVPQVPSFWLLKS